MKSAPALLITTLLLTSLSWLSHAADEDWQVPVTVGKDGWMRYENPRFGFVILVPPGMGAQRPPDNGAGQAFISPDGRVSLVASASFNVDHLGDLEKRWNEELAEKGRKITYKRKTDGWFVLSGENDDGSAFYMRYTANEKYCATWIMTYPHAEDKLHAPWVERIAKGYDARLGQGEDKLE